MHAPKEPTNSKVLSSRMISKPAHPYRNEGAAFKAQSRAAGERLQLIVGHVCNVYAPR